MLPKLLTAALLAGAVLSGSALAQVTVTPRAYILGSGAAVGAVYFTDGTKTLPSITFLTQPATGIYFAGSSVVGFAAADYVASGFSSTGLVVDTASSIGWRTGAFASSANDVSLFRDAANILAQRNGVAPTTAQAFRIYETFTDVSTDYERFEIVMGSDLATLRTATAGTGADNQSIDLTATGTGSVNATGRFGLKTKQVVLIDAVTTFAATSSYVNFQCTGAETLNTITGGVPGMLLIIENVDTECTIADAATADAISLDAADVGAVDKLLILIYNGTYWQKLSESDN